MKRKLLLGAMSILMAFSGFAQLRIIDHGTVVGTEITEPGGDVDLSGTTQSVEFDTDNTDHVMEFWVENLSETETYTVRCRRIETDVVPGSFNNVCWDVCPLYPIAAGVDPDWTVTTGPTIRQEVIAPGGIATSFAFHYEPTNTIGISTFEVRFVDAADEDFTYTSFNIEYDHDGIVGIEEVFNENTFKLTPNPANDIVGLNLSSITGNVNVQIFNVLGEVVMERSNVTGGQLLQLETSEMQSGIYMVSVMQNNKILNTSRLMVKH